MKSAFETAELGQFCSKYFDFPLWISFHNMLHNLFHLCVAVTRKTKGTSLGNFKKNVFWKLGTLEREYLHYFLSFEVFVYHIFN